MSRSVRINGPRSVRGRLKVPPDKSISHRIALLASLAKGRSRITGLASSADCRATLDCIRRLGVGVEESGAETVIDGAGLFGYRSTEPVIHLNAGNSGSTMRMLSGLLAGQRFVSQIDGDASLRRRPMARIIEPLTRMGARIEAREGNFPPLRIEGGQLRAIDHSSPVASAQVKSCVLLAGLLARGRTVFSEPAQSRNHTEILLAEMNARIDVQSSALSVEGLHELTPIDYHVPGDVSSAAFFLAAAGVLTDSELSIQEVGLNPTRTAFIDALNRLGARVEGRNVRSRHGEPVGDLLAETRQLKSETPATMLSGAVIPNLIDEIPILAVVATQVDGRVEVRDARELRIKESDRIRTVADGIRALGGEIEEFEDGFAINGPQRLKGGRVETAGDHRIAMAFAVAGLIADGTTEITDADCAAVSFPEFYQTLASVTPPGTIEFA
jgi:3-phosphoshikimate 1-carboxyvinyltransferase